MRALCLIDSLRPGGAQRQLCTLGILLRQRGFDVTFLTYYPHDFFVPLIREAGIGYNCIHALSGTKAGRIRAIRNVLRTFGQDVVLSFMDGSNLYAELAALPTRSWGLVVSERCAFPNRHDWREWALRTMHFVADYVTTNSHSNRLLIEETKPTLAGRVVTIYNAVDLNRFRPATSTASRSGTSIRISVAATYEPRKNLVGLIDAIALLRSRPGNLDVQVDWYGGIGHMLPNGRPDTRYYDAWNSRIVSNGLEGRFRLNLEANEIERIYRDSDAVLLPSFFEGVPNVICEAMACGRPVLMSNNCDASNLVEPGKNGFLFDPNSPKSIADAIESFAGLTQQQRDRFGNESRARAERYFDPVAIADRYYSVLKAASERRQVPMEHWIPSVPESAIRTVNIKKCR